MHKLLRRSIGVVWTCVLSARTSDPAHPFHEPSPLPRARFQSTKRFNAAVLLINEHGASSRLPKVLARVLERLPAKVLLRGRPAPPPRPTPVPTAAARAQGEGPFTDEEAAQLREAFALDEVQYDAFHHSISSAH